MSDGATPEEVPQPAAAPRPPRGLTLADRVLWAPLGLLWLGVLAIVAVPAFLWMSFLYYTTLCARALRRFTSRTKGRAAPLS